MTAATAAPATELDQVAADFPGWRIWTSRPRGWLWATRLGAVPRKDQRRPAEWTMTAGPAADPAALRAILTQQARLDACPDPLGSATDPPEEGDRDPS